MRAAKVHKLSQKGLIECMVNTPFGPYDSGYSDESEVFLEYESPLMVKLSKAVKLYDLLSELNEDEDTESSPYSDSATVSESSAPVAQSPAPEKTPSVQARFLSDLVERIVAEGKLLLTEDGRAFAYQEDGEERKQRRASRRCGRQGAGHPLFQILQGRCGVSAPEHARS